MTAPAIPVAIAALLEALVASSVAANGGQTLLAHTAARSAARVTTGSVARPVTTDAAETATRKLIEDTAADLGAP